MTDTTKIGMRLWNGYLSFDQDRIDDHDEDLASWLENAAVEDLLHGDYPFEIEVEVVWHSNERPTLYHVTVTNV